MKNVPNGTKNHERKLERMKGRWERFWHSRVGARIGIKMRREAFLLYERERRNPSWMNYKCHPSKRERQVKKETLLGFGSELGFEG
jgi:hypothetical protein